MNLWMHLAILLLPSVIYTEKRFKRQLPLTSGNVIANVTGAVQNCRAFRFKQTVSHKGCYNRTIWNKGCYGYCNSIVFPQANPVLDLKIVGTCVNDKTKYKAIKLVCPGRKKGYKLKDILIVKTCKCKLSRPLGWESVSSNCIEDIS